MSEPLRVALAGLGTVGGGVIKLLDANRDLIAQHAEFVPLRSLRFQRATGTANGGSISPVLHGATIRSRLRAVRMSTLLSN